ncbi:MAG: tyrosine-type recombinase/integrase, partial [Rikenellaceae bacterium]
SKYESETDYLMPIITKKVENERRFYQNELAKINIQLKKLSELLSLQMPLTMYVARHSWASVAKSKNVPLSVISEGMGHDSEVTTQIYLASLDTAVVDKANRMILKLLG